jgi:hypothetical protein
MKDIRFKLAKTLWRQRDFFEAWRKPGIFALDSFEGSLLTSVVEFHPDHLEMKK